MPPVFISLTLMMSQASARIAARASAGSRNAFVEADRRRRPGTDRPTRDEIAAAHWLFDPADSGSLEPADRSDRGCDIGPSAVGIDTDLHVATGTVPDSLDDRLATRVKNRWVADRQVHLEHLDPADPQGASSLERLIGLLDPIERIGLGHGFASSATDQFVQWPPGGLALQIPQGHFDRRTSGPVPVHGRPPIGDDLLGIERAAPEDRRPKQRNYRGIDGFRGFAGVLEAGDSFAVPREAYVGRDRDQDTVDTASVGRLLAGPKDQAFRPRTGDLHRCSPQDLIC
jgi:hypothetical protein